MTKTKKTNKNRSVKKEFDSNFAAREALTQVGLSAIPGVGPIGAAAIRHYVKKKK